MTTQDLRHVPHKLHSAIEMAAGLLGLPLDARQREALALEMTGPVRALIAEALAAVSDDAPVRYAVTETEPPQPGQGFEVSEFAGCTTRTGLDVDLDSPAGTVAGKVRRQPEVTAVEIRDAYTIAVTVNPPSPHAWRWWLDQFEITPAAIALEGSAATATGTRDGAVVHLRGEGVRELYADRAAASLMCLIEPAQQ